MLAGKWQLTGILTVFAKLSIIHLEMARSLRIATKGSQRNGNCLQAQHSQMTYLPIRRSLSSSSLITQYAGKVSALKLSPSPYQYQLPLAFVKLFRPASSLHIFKCCQSWNPSCNSGCRHSWKRKGLTGFLPVVHERRRRNALGSLVWVIWVKGGHAGRRNGQLLKN
jgi:hypothetical protein